MNEIKLNMLNLKKPQELSVLRMQCNLDKFCKQLS